ncbi:MAG: hypothetical protein ACHQF3_03280 [Alphaproteobacteria bacterium]
MRSVIALLAFLGSCLGGFQAYGQSPQDSLSLGTAVLTLGMSKAAVTAALKDAYTLRDLGIGGSFVVTRSAAPHDAVGTIAFANGKVAGVARNWGPKDQLAGVEIATALAGAVEELVPQGHRACDIGIEQAHDQSYEAKTITLACGKKRIEIKVGRVNRNDVEADFSLVTEILDGK